MDEALLETVNDEGGWSDGRLCPHPAAAGGDIQIIVCLRRIEVALESEAPARRIGLPSVGTLGVEKDEVAAAKTAVTAILNEDRVLPEVVDPHRKVGFGKHASAIAEEADGG